MEALLTDKTRLIEVPFIINNQEHSAIIDTGSFRNIISYSFASQLNLKFYPCEEKIRLQVVNGKIVVPNSQVILHIKIGSQNFGVKALVIPNFGYNLLLGLHFLFEAQARLDFKSRHVSIGDDSFSFPTGFVQEEIDKPLKTVRREIIPARSEKILLVTGTSLSSTMIIEPNNSSFEKYDIAVARILTKKDIENVVPVRVCNPNLRPVTVPKGATIARGFDVVGIKTINPSHEPTLTTTDYDDDLSHQQTDPDMKNDQQVLDELDINPNLNKHQKKVILDMFYMYLDIMSRGDLDIGRTSYIKHSIETGDAEPIRKHPYRRSFAERKVMKEFVEEMMKHDIVEESDSPWSSPVVLVRKRDGKWRFCVDWRELNKVTKKDSMPLPRIDDTLDRLSGCQYFTKIDLTSGYYQVDLESEAIPKTAFVTPDGHYQFKRLGMGLCNAPATFQRLMYKVLGNLLWTNSMAYLDDIVVFSKNFDDHINHVREVLDRLRQAGLKLKPKKCSVARKFLPYLGHVVSGTGVTPDPENLKALYRYPIPRTKTQVQEFIGLTSYYRRFIPDYSTKAKPLTALTKNVPFEWTLECQEAFETLRHHLLSSPILTHPDFTREFFVYTDASAYGVGAILKQIDDNGKERVIAYASRVLSKPECNYSATERECLAVVFATQKFRPYLYGTKFTVVTDHCSLCWLQKVKNPNGRLARWGMILQDFEYEIVYKSGKKHLDADALSRNPIESEKKTDAPDASICPVLVLTEEQVDSIRRDQQQEEWIRSLLAVHTDPQASHKRNIKRQARCYSVKEGLLHRNICTDGCIKQALVLPETMKREILESLHDDQSAGHLGISKTFNKIRSRYYWPRMYSQIVNYVQSCTQCNQKKTCQQAPVGQLQPLPPVIKPFARIGFDKLGPFPESLDGNKHVWVVTDYATRLVIAAPSPNGTAAEAAKFFLNQVILKFGSPRELVTDRGVEFCNELFKKVTELYSVKHRRTTAYHPRTNGLTERFNKTLADMMSHYVNESHTDWDRFLPFLVQAYNTSTHETTGYSPFFLMHGYEADLMIDQAMALPSDNLDDYTSISFENLMFRNKARELAAERIAKSQEKSKERFDKNRRDHKYKSGDLVWVKFPTAKVGKAKKLLYTYRGPFRLTLQTAANDFEIEDSKGKTEVVNVERFKPYHEREDMGLIPNPSPNQDLSQDDVSPSHARSSPEPPTVTFNDTVETSSEDGSRSTIPLVTDKPRLCEFPPELDDELRLDSIFDPDPNPEPEIEESLDPLPPPRRSSRKTKTRDLNYTFI